MRTPRLFFDYGLATEINNETMNLRKYRIPDDVRAVEGWESLP